jgi:neutral ceramidase
LRIEQERNGTGPAVWVAAYANDVFGYIPSSRVLAEGGYEGGEAFYYSTFPTPFAEGTEETIMSGVREVIGRVRGK